MNGIWKTTNKLNYQTLDKGRDNPVKHSLYGIYLEYFVTVTGLWQLT